MNVNKKIEQLQTCKLNCNIFNVYDYDGLSNQELLCQFFTKINECIDLANSTIDLANWLVNEGLEIEVAKQLNVWLEDGTLNDVINVGIFNDLNDTINSVKSRIVCVSDFGALGDGVTNDGPAILKAMLSLKTSPVKVLHFEKDKVYKIDDGLEMEVDGITLEGNGATITTQNDLIGNMIINGIIGGQYKLYNGCSDITFNNLNFRGKKEGTSNCALGLGHANNIRITNCNFYDISAHAIDAGGVDGLYIENCKFIGSPKADHTLKEAIQLDYASPPGFSVFGEYDKTVTKNLTVKNCYFGASENYPCWERGVGAHTAFKDGIFSNVVIEDNEINVVSTAVSFYTTNVENIFINNNVITTTSENGYALEMSPKLSSTVNTSNIIFSNNKCRCGYGVFIASEVDVNSINILNNTFNVSNTGVRLQATESNVTGININSNIIEGLNTAIGIKVLNCKDANISYNSIQHCNYAAFELNNCIGLYLTNNNTSECLKYGVLSDKMNKFYVKNNSFTDISSSAIVFNYNTAGAFTNIEVNNNVITNIGYYGSPGLQNRGIQGANTNNCVVKDNCIVNVNSTINYIVLSDTVNGVACDNVLMSTSGSAPTLALPNKVHNINNNLLSKIL